MPQSDLFVLASRFEGYGMAYAEAMAHGLPVIGTTAGAIPDTVPPDAGVLVEPDDVKALTRALRMLIENPKERQWFAAGARAAASALPTWEESAKLSRRRDRGAGMSFTAGWLELREPYDRRARNAAVLDAVVAALAGRPSVTIVDLACGTGSTFRALMPRIKSRQNWRLVDNDLSLLARAPQSSPPDVNVTTVPVDLSRDLEAALDGPVDLVTTSALLDLVSDEWLRAARGRDRGAAAAGLCGAELRRARRARRRPMPPTRRSSPRSTSISAATRASVRRSGRRRRRPRSSASSASAMRWCRARPTGCSRPQDREIQIEMLSGWAAAAREIGDLPLADVIGWLTRRRDLVAAGRSSIRVGHVDFFARPTAHALSRQVAVEQHLVVEPVHAHRRAQRLVDARDRRQREARPAGAEDDRRDHDVQPVEALRCKKARHRIGAAFDQDAAQAALGERRQDCGRRDLAVGLGQCRRSRRRPAAAACAPSPVTTRRRTPSSASSLAPDGSRPPDRSRPAPAAAR